jgi:hypothetical protein
MKGYELRNVIIKEDLKIKERLVGFVVGEVGLG